MFNLIKIIRDNEEETILFSRFSSDSTDSCAFILSTGDQAFILSTGDQAFILLTCAVAFILLR